MQTSLHVEGLDLLRKSIIIGVIAAIVSVIGTLFSGFGAMMMPAAAPTAAPATSMVFTIIATLINLVSWYFHFRGWGSLCKTGVEGFFCTTYTAVKWGMLAAYILILLGSLMLFAAGPSMMPAGPPHRPPRPPRPGAMVGLMAGGALSGLGGLIALVVTIIVLIAYFKLANIYQAPNVKWGAILLVVGALLVVIGIGAILMLIGLALLYIGLGNAIDNVQRGVAPKTPGTPGSMV